MITEFTGNYSFLSMYYHRHQTSGVMFSFYDENEVIKTEEHFLDFPNVDLALKASSISDKEVQEKIANLSPNNMGLEILNDKENPVLTRPGWCDKRKNDVMYLLLRDKFSNKNIGVKLALLATNYDKIIYSAPEKEQEDPFWSKDNAYGKILMRLRRELIEEDGNFKYCLRNYLIRNDMAEIESFIKIDSEEDIDE